MIDFQQKRKFNKILYSKVTFVILVIVIIFLARATYNVYKKSKLSVDNYAAVKRDYDELVARKEMMTSEINRLNTDTGMEEEIRSRFDVAKPGETVVVVINSSSGSSTPNNSNKGFWSSFWGMFSAKGGSASGGN